MIGPLLMAVMLAAPTPTAPPTPDTVDAALVAIEEAGRSLAGMTADVVYVRVDPVLERKETRSGRVIHRRGESPAVAILFDTLVVGRRREDRSKHWIFSGPWIVEIDPGRMQFIKRAIGPADATFDPFDLAHGPVPLPIGQSRDEVLRRFVVTAVDVPEAGLLSTLDSDAVQGLHLVPRGEDQWKQLDIYFERSTWLPVGVDALEEDGTRRMARLDALRAGSLSAEDAAHLSIDAPSDPGWSISIEAWVEAPEAQDEGPS